MIIAPRSAAYLALLVGLASFGPVTMSIYTPVMPSVGTDLHTTPEFVKYTLTTYMLGFAVGQLFYGPLSDRFGRRPILLFGLVFFAASTIGCSFAPEIGSLIGLRIVQGIGAASGSVLSRALTRDAYDFNEMPRIMSWIALVLNVAPAISPSIGGFLGEAYGWRSTFWFVGGWGVLLLVVVIVGLGETNKFKGKGGASFASLLQGSGIMLRDRRFLGYVLTLSFAFAINFGMLSGTPFILQDRLGFSPREFGLITLMSVAGFTAGSFATNRLIGRVMPVTLLRIAGWFHVAAMAVLATFCLCRVETWWAITGPYMVLSFGSGMIGPNSSAGAVGLYPRLAGTASSWVGLAQMGMGAVGTVVVALLTPLGAKYMALPLVVGLAPFAILTVLSARLLKKPA
ncbi:MAG TPA: multidrug effflux MFS transporter [Reyranella sp.]|nr:multidrug effflux MFS transporter [Reyranella sp.]